jgi:hypothetical protein
MGTARGCRKGSIAMAAPASQQTIIQIQAFEFHIVESIFKHMILIGILYIAMQ